MNVVTRLADPRRCPSCRSSLPSGSLVCGTCHLDLHGERGVRLFALLTEADALIAQMRAGVTVAAGRGPDPSEARATAAPPPTTTGAGAGVGMATVPKVLLGLGALCVLVAASLFLPFAWSLLGVLGRTLVLVMLTVAAGAAAGAAGRRGLRATAESLGVVALGLLAFDLLGARSSGWLGDVSGAAFSVLLGAVLLVAGTATTIWLRRTAVGAFVTGEVVAVVGATILLIGVAELGTGTVAHRLALVVPLLGAVTLGAARLRIGRPGPDSMAVATYGLLGVTVTAWTALVLSGLAELPGGLSWAAMWPGGAGPTLLLAGVYAAAPASSRRLGIRTRAGLLAVGLVPWALVLTAPAYDEGATWRTLAVLAPLVVCLTLLPLVPRSWRLAGVPTGLLCALAATALVTPLAVSSLSTYVATVVPAWTGSPGGRAAPLWDAGSLGSPWLLPLVVVALSATVLAVAREIEPRDGPAPTSLAPLVVLGAGLTVLGVSGALLLEAAPVWLVLVVLVAGTLGAAALAWDTGRIDAHAAQLALAAGALGLSWYDEWLTLGACLLLLGPAVAHHLRGSLAVRVSAGLASCLLLAGAIWTGGALLGAAAPWRSLVVLLVVAAVVIVRGLLDDRAASLGVELGGSLAAGAATWAGIERASAEQAATWLAVHLTVAGVATTVVALTRPERRGAGWAGGLLLAAASWVRLADIGVSTPEAYTLPAAFALLVTGWHRTRRDAAAGTAAAWSPGLGLALLPSLLWALADPLSWRALLLGLACLVLAVAGAQLRLTAPFVWGAGVGGTLVLWEVVPPALEMSAWLVIGVAGAALLVLGASWEQRVKDARSALGYLRTLR
jgi:hypothetical protein